MARDPFRSYPFAPPTPEERQAELRRIVLEYSKSTGHAMVRPVRNQHESWAQSELYEVMVTFWPPGHLPPSSQEMRECLMGLVLGRKLARWKDPVAPAGVWMEPRFRRLPEPKAPAAPRQTRSLTRLDWKYRYRGSHKCDRCGVDILGTGRHGKSARGHGKAECDAAMVAHLMSR